MKGEKGCVLFLNASHDELFDEPLVYMVAVDISNQHSGKVLNLEATVFEVHFHIRRT
jgi:hypothetical protein